MTKEEVKIICESDDKLQWWAMVLFAEISDLFYHTNPSDRDDAVMKVIQAKVDEFPRMIVHEVLERAKAVDAEKGDRQD